MKVLQIINSLNTGGAEKLVLELLPLFTEKGLEVDLLILNGIEYPFLENLRKIFNGSIYSLGTGSVYNPLLVFKIIPYISKYDIINVHLFPSIYWVSFAKALSFSKTKLVYTEHNTHNKRRNSKWFKIIDRIVYKSYKKIITISDEVDYNIKKHLDYSNSKFQLINNGINTNLYKTALPYNKNKFFSKNDSILIQVSSFREQKDQQTLIKSIKLLPKNIKLLLVGEGPLIENSKKLVKELNLKSRVSFLGIRMDVPRLLKTADIVVLSSHHEGLSLSSIEGMASGRPLVASNVAGLREIVKDAGVLFESENNIDLSNKIKELLNNQHYYNQIIDSCLLRAKEFDIDKMANKYLKLYNTINHI